MKLSTREVPAHKIHTVSYGYDEYTVVERGDGSCVVSEISHTGSMRDNSEVFDPPFPSFKEAMAWIKGREQPGGNTLPARPGHAKGYGKR